VTPIDDVIDLYPETVFHTHAFNRVCTDPGGLYDIDQRTGIATNCGGRNFTGIALTESI